MSPTIRADPAARTLSVDAGKLCIRSVITTIDPDRAGDIVVPTGLRNHDDFMMNPVVLWAHNRTQFPPIGVCEWIDVQPLQRLEHGLPGPAEERDALLDLGRLRGVLQEEDVGERVTGAEDRDAQLVARARELVAELVDLGDRSLQVPLVDLVGGHGGWHGVSGPFSVSGPSP